ncbi:TPA: hypothetical protein ACH3X1_012931, partial [Trebouxia sp. C0004]
MPSHAELVGGSRQYDRESTNWTDSTLPSSDSFGLDSPEALLSSLGRSMDSLPPEMSYSLKQGIMSTELLQRWLHWEQRYLLRQLLRFPGMRERVLGDAAFLMKLGVEAGMGVITKLLAELHKRPVKFWGELDLVFANVVMSLLADVALIW